MTALFEKYVIPLIALACAVSGFAVAWNWQGSRLDTVTREYSDYVIHAEANAKMTEAKRIAAQTRWMKEIEDAEENSRRREAAMEVAAADSRAALDRLRRANTALQSRLANASRYAAIETAAAASGLLAECAGTYRDVAEACERHVDDLRTLIEAWPKNLSPQ